VRMALLTEEGTWKHNKNRLHNVAGFFNKYHMRLIFGILVFLLVVLFANQSVSEPLVVNRDYVITKIDDNTIKFSGSFVEQAGLMLVMSATSMDTKTLIISSPGGLMSEAAMVGLYLADANVRVIIEKDTMCVSACAYAIMKAPDVDIRGKVVFHPPYYPYVPTEETLYSVLHSSSMMNLELVSWFIESGYTLEFLKLIHETTDNQTFMVFDNFESLKKFKSNDISYLPDNFTEYYTIMTGDELFK